MTKKGNLGYEEEPSIESSRLQSLYLFFHCGKCFTKKKKKSSCDTGKQMDACVQLSVCNDGGVPAERAVMGGNHRRESFGPVLRSPEKTPWVKECLVPSLKSRKELGTSKLRGIHH